MTPCIDRTALIKATTEMKHDFGSINLRSHRIFWKMNCYDKTPHAQLNAEDADVTACVLTIMLAEE
jgi:hypothetical protein